MGFREFRIARDGTESIADSVQPCPENHQHLKEVIIYQFGDSCKLGLQFESGRRSINTSTIAISNEGGFAPPISEPHKAHDLLVRAMSDAGHEGRIKCAIYPASSEFFKSGNYDLGFKNSKADSHAPKQLMHLYRTLLENCPTVLLENPFSESDWASWTEFCEQCPVDFAGDDPLVTNRTYVREAHERMACNSMLLKINQVDTISEAIESSFPVTSHHFEGTKFWQGNLAYSYGWSVFISHRSGETTDDFIADLVVELRTGHIKSGAPCRGEHVAKYNRLLDIEELLGVQGEEVVYAGENFRSAYTLKPSLWNKINHTILSLC